MLVEYEYERGGTLAYLAAGICTAPSCSDAWSTPPAIALFGRLVRQVMSAEPYRLARHVFWVLDNGSSHRGAAAVQRLQQAHANLVPVHLAVHASWLNQVEIYFSILQRKVLTPPGGGVARGPRRHHPRLSGQL